MNGSSCEVKQKQQPRTFSSSLRAKRATAATLFLAASSSTSALAFSAAASRGVVGGVAAAFSNRSCSAAHSLALSYCSKTQQHWKPTNSVPKHSIHRCRDFGSLLQMSSSSSSSQPMSTSTKDETKSGVAANRHPLSNLRESFDHSWVSQLSTEAQHNKIKSYERSASGGSYRGRTTPPRRSSSAGSAAGPSENNEEEGANRTMRPVYNGHYVFVKPTPLKNPRLVIHSPSMASTLQLSEDDVHSEQFTKFFSGDVHSALSSSDNDEEKFADHPTWATPYALSIMGTRYTSNCPYGTGDGYGDGRAISIGEVLINTEDGTTTTERYEMQLKGAGPTPFCRGADGRAVLRSSVREFLASEAMHELGVPTTRALCLIVSQGPNGDTSNRPWYSNTNKRGPLPTLDDPRLAQYSLEQRKQIIAQLSIQSKNDPDVMIQEPCAITTRVCPSFVRVGHFDLFSRRAVAGMANAPNEPYDTTAESWKELEELTWHAAFRDYKSTAYDPYIQNRDIKSASLALLEGAATQISNLVSDWVRVGFAQGNFNADNCLIAGRTMDYGPFGFMDEYHPLFAKWTGSGEHFGFLNQPSAGYANYVVLVESVLPLISAQAGENWMEEEQQVKEQLLTTAQEIFQDEIERVFRSKLGFELEEEIGSDLWRDLEPLIREVKTDWTLFWRRLTMVMKEYPSLDATNYDDMLNILVGNEDEKASSSPFYEALTEDYRNKMLEWIRMWRKGLKQSYNDDNKKQKVDMENSSGSEMSVTYTNSKNDTTDNGNNRPNWRTLPSDATPYERMKLSNPKYVLREWMLVEAYRRASKGDENMIFELLDLVSDPYGERSGEDEEDYDNKYFRRAPDEALTAGGTAFMS